MSKSTGNSILPSEIYTGDNDILSKPFSASVTRFFIMQAHYSSVLDLSNDALLAAEKGHNRLMEALAKLENINSGKESTFNVVNWKTKCYQAMNDDFNTPILISHLFEAVKQVNLMFDNKVSLTQDDLALFKNTLNGFTFDVLGLIKEADGSAHTDKLKGVIEMLIDMRAEAKANKNYALSDEIRDKLLALEIQLKDSREGTTFTI